MRITILFAITGLFLSGCSSLTPEQNGQLLNAGINLGTAAALKALNQK